MDSILSFVWNLVKFIIAIGALAFLHELGHFLMARLFKVEVEEFGLGFPPRLLKIGTWGGTEFTLNKIPFGAFVRPKGENDPNVPGGLAAANPWKRLGVLLGGSVMNLLVGALIFTIIIARDGLPIRHIQIADVTAATPAQTAGFQPEDVILTVNGLTPTNSTELRSITQDNLGKEMVFSVQRGDTTIELRATPRTTWPADQGPLGVMLNETITYQPVSLLLAPVEGVKDTLDMSREIIMMPVRLIRGEVSGDAARVVSIVGVFQMFQQVDAINQETQAANPQAPTLDIFWFTGFISVALGLTNLLPLPALDGGRILFVLPEILFRKRVKPEFENTVHAVGFALLLILMVVLVANDLLNPITIR